MHGIFITFEGIDGSGKTTQIKLLSDFLRSLGFKTVLTREPGGTRIGDMIRDILLNPENDGMSARAETFLFQAARAELIEKVIKPELEKGKIVICDRFFDSTLVYQGIARGLGIEDMLNISLWATSGIEPDKTFLLSLNVVDSEKRLDKLLKKKDRIEHEKTDFKEKLKTGYIEIAHRFKKRITIVDANNDIDAIFNIIRQNTIGLLRNKGWLTNADR